VSYRDLTLSYGPNLLRTYHCACCSVLSGSFVFPPHATARTTVDALLPPAPHWHHVTHPAVHVMLTEWCTSYLRANADCANKLMIGGCVVVAVVRWVGMALLKTAWCGTRTPGCLGASHLAAQHHSCPFYTYTVSDAFFPRG
jgi:hypothetical protein